MLSFGGRGGAGLKPTSELLGRVVSTAPESRSALSPFRPTGPLVGVTPITPQWIGCVPRPGRGGPPRSPKRDAISTVDTAGWHLPEYRSLAPASPGRSPSATRGVTSKTSSPAVRHPASRSSSASSSAMVRFRAPVPGVDRSSGRGSNGEVAADGDIVERVQRTRHAAFAEEGHPPSMEQIQA
jgi:hypothetical protein